MSKQAIGIIAGWGEFPLVVARALREQGNTVVVAAVRQHASEEIEQIAHHVKWVGVCKLGGMQRYFVKHGVENVCMSGKLFKDRILFHGWGWLQHFPDWECARTMFPLFYSRYTTTTDDSLLGAVVKSFSRRNIKTIPGTEYAPQLLAEAGVLTRRKPSATQIADIEFGWNIAKQMGGLDIGQSVTVRDRTVLAVEAIEGTDACIARTGQICPRGGFSLVKVAKPQQDMRFDVPTIGPQTIERMQLMGGKAIAIEAGKTILINRVKTLQMADDFGIAILSRT
ncbi:MAG: UDP-2,3-diacylglucosamine diphosphatase LpxI [Pirellula sp.]